MKVQGQFGFAGTPGQHGAVTTTSEMGPESWSVLECL